MDQDRIKKCREWIARRTAELDQKTKEFEDQYPFCTPDVNKARMDSLEAKRFWVDIHLWELEQMIETGVDDYPQQTNND